MAASARIQQIVYPLTKSAVVRSGVMLSSGLFIYTFFLRGIMWRWTLSLAKLFWSLPRSNATLSTIPQLGPQLLLRSLWAGFLLVLLWEASITAFGITVSREPLKYGNQPLTASEPPKQQGGRLRIPDPDAALLGGLKAKRDVPKALSFWELSYIANRYPDRRKAIFEGIDRIGGSTFGQIKDACLASINAMNTRITEFQNPPSRLNKAQSEQQQLQLESLPQIASPIQSQDVFTASRSPNTLRSNLNAFGSKEARRLGENQETWTPKAQIQAKAAITWVSEKTLPSEIQGKPLDHVKGRVTPFLVRFLMSPFGWPFRQTFARRVNRIVFGSPYSNLGPVIDAINSLTQLLICSLQEDPYGKAQTEVPLVVRTYTMTIQLLEGFVKSMPVHWTDVYFSDDENGEGRKVDEVQDVLGALRGGLKELLGAYRNYLADVGVVGRELREARELAGVE